MFSLGARANLLSDSEVAQDDFAWVDGITFQALDAPQASRLAATHWLESMVTLELSNNPVGDWGVMALAGSRHVVYLRSLFLRGSGIGDAGAAALAKSSNLVRLEALSLAHNQIEDEGATTLAQSALLKHLRVVNLEDNHIGPAGNAALRATAAAHPRLWLHLGNHL
jgi:hypothetical protein